LEDLGTAIVRDLMESRHVLLKNRPDLLHLLGGQMQARTDPFEHAFNGNHRRRRDFSPHAPNQGQSGRGAR
jgi:hypothetical protein